MKALLGEGLCYGSIHKVETNRFAPASLEGKLVMVDDDLNLSALPSTNNLKTIVTAEAPIELERKGVQSHQGLLNCRFLGFGNGMLTSLYDSSDGFYRRQIVLEALPKPADREDDPYLIDRLKEELPGIFLWCIEGLKRLIDANYRFTISERAARRMRELRTEQDTVQSFLDSSGYIRLTDEGRTASAGLYDCYRRWCQDNSCREVSSSRFTQELKDRADRYGLRYTNGIPLMKGKRVRGFHGIEVIDQPFGCD